MNLRQQRLTGWWRPGSRPRLAAIAVLGGLAAIGFVFAGCSATTPASASTVAAAPTKTPQPGSTGPVNIYLSILTPEQTGRDEYPAYLPSDVTVPANSTVTFVITNFDDATPLTAAQFAKVSGTLNGNMTVAPLEAGNPNGVGPASVVSQLSPDQVSHTFTVPTLGLSNVPVPASQLNVPIPANSRVTFTIHTGAPGVYHWYCLDPCGTGPDGLGGPMVTPGYMQGTIVVA